MKIKVCGMKNPENITQLLKLPIDFMGLIFYPKSVRYVDNLVLTEFEKSILKVGVFINEEVDFIKEKVEQYRLDYLQLHGNESVENCIQLKEKLRLPIIKAFNIAEVSDFEITQEYERECNYFLFDTKTPLYGGSGQKFNWAVLNNYKGEIPFFLSGGISAEDVEEIKGLKHPKLYGLDLNSRFEIEPGLKDIQLVEKFIKQLNS